MTYEEAIKMLDRIRHEGGWTNDAYDSLTLAIKAIAKQIAKRPKLYEWDKEMHRYTECCPTCGDTWNMNEFGEGMKYCWECGQAILWEE